MDGETVRPVVRILLVVAGLIIVGIRGYDFLSRLHHSAPQVQISLRTGTEPARYFMRATPGPYSFSSLSSHSFSSVAISPDSRLLAAGSYDNSITLWDFASGKEIRTLSGHTDSVSSVAFSPDSRVMASGS